MHIAVEKAWVEIQKGRVTGNQQSCSIFSARFFASVMTVKSGFVVNAQSPFNKATGVLPSKLHRNDATV